MKKDDVIRLISMFAATLPNVNLNDEMKTEALVDAWMIALDGIDYNLGLAAAQSVMRTHKISVLPQPGQVYQAAIDLIAVHMPTSAAAWNIARLALGRCGHEKAVEALKESDPVIAGIVQSIGAERMWWETCSTCQNNPDAMRREFMKTYDSQIERFRTSAVMPSASLAGFVGSRALTGMQRMLSAKKQNEMPHWQDGE